MVATVQLPEPRTPGRPSKADQRKRHRELARFAAGLKHIQDNQLNGPIGKRSWCYYLESIGEVSKGEFDRVEDLLDEARREGYLPLTFVADDDACAFNGELERATPTDPEEQAVGRVRGALDELEAATAADYWIGKNALWHHYAGVHPWMVVEKTDLKTEVFGPVCEEYGVPIANARGQSNIATRGYLRERFKAAWESGCVPVLLYAGDHDPDGLRMADGREWREKFSELRDDPWINDLQVIHVAIGAEFIDAHGIDWIHNLESSNGRERRASDGAFVENYLARFGRRKVEANSLVVPEYREAAQSDLRGTLDALLGDARERRQDDLEAGRERAEAVGSAVPIDDVKRRVENALAEFSGGGR